MLKAVSLQNHRIPHGSSRLLLFSCPLGPRYRKGDMSIDRVPVPSFPRGLARLPQCRLGPL